MRLTEVWRHPIKAHGREPVAAFEIERGGTIPFDRLWAVAHEASKLEGGAWVSCANFARAAKTPALMAITSRSDSDMITLSHPDRPDLTFDPDADGRVFLDWIAPLTNPERAAPTGIVRAQDRGFTDSPLPSISLQSLASHASVERRAGRDLSRHRWRGNLWIDGTEPWEELDWIGRDLTIGTAQFRAEERIGRCRATMASPTTGLIDADTLGALETERGRREFGIYLSCIAPGRVAIGDAVTLS